jgi:hypothetical protein
MDKELKVYESFYGVSVIVIFASGFFGRINLLLESRLKFIFVFVNYRYRFVSKKSSVYKFSKRLYL